jgi:predicted transcriptional regulator
MKQQQLKKKSLSSIKKDKSVTTTTKIGFKMLEQFQSSLSESKISANQTETEFSEELNKSNCYIADYLIFIGMKLNQGNNIIKYGDASYLFNFHRSTPKRYHEFLQKIGIITTDGNHITDIGRKLLGKYMPKIISKTRIKSAGKQSK